MFDMVFMGFGILFFVIIGLYAILWCSVRVLNWLNRVFEGFW